MAITFPNSPTVGQQYVAENGYTYEYDGEKWSTLPDSEGQIPAGGTTGQFLAKVNNTDYNMEWTDAAPPTSIGTTPPTGDLEDGQLWWRSDTGVLYIYYGDGDSSQWVQAAVGMDTRVQAEVYTGDVPPLGPGEGDLWWNTTDTNLYVYYQSVWVQSNPVPPEQPNYWQRDAATGVVSPSTEGDDVQVASLNSGPLAGFRNQLINGDFRVWQRNWTGTATSAAPYPSADRWALTDGVRLQRDTAVPVGAGFAWSADINAAATIRQGIEIDAQAPQNNIFTNGSEWTLSLYATVQPSGWNLSFQDDNNGTNQQVAASGTFTAVSAADANGFTRYTATGTISGAAIASSRCLAVNIQFGAAAKFVGIMLEPGPVSTPFEVRPLSTELAICERYFQLIKTPVAFKMINGATGIGVVDYRTTMRAAGSVPSNGDSGLSIQVEGGTSTGFDVNWSPQSASNTALHFAVNRVSGTAFTAGSWCVCNSIKTILAVDAEL
ncbi:tail fiber protein [Synechococcus phage MA10]